MNQKLYVIVNRETRQYFTGFSKGEPTWAEKIENAIPYAEQGDADEDYESLRGLGLDVMVK